MHNVYFRLLQSHRTNVSKELNRLRFHWGTRTAREEEDSDNIGAVERDGDEGDVVDWDSLPDDLLRRVGELVNVGSTMQPSPPRPTRPQPPSVRGQAKKAHHQGSDSVRSHYKSEKEWVSQFPIKGCSLRVRVSEIVMCR